MGGIGRKVRERDKRTLLIASAFCKEEDGAYIILPKTAEGGETLMCHFEARGVHVKFAL